MVVNKMQDHESSRIVLLQVLTVDDIIYVDFPFSS